MQNIGVCFLLFLSPLDNSIKLNNDKSTLLDKSWNGSILKYFNNTGKVIQNFRKIKNAIEAQSYSNQIVKEIENYYQKITYEINSLS